jgi:hypothetical protein
MKTAALSWAAAAMLAPALLLAESLTVDGVTYRDVQWGTVTPATVSIIHATGVCTVPLENLSADLQRRFGYQPEEAARYRIVLEARQTAQLRCDREVAAQRAAQVERLRAIAEQRRRHPPERSVVDVLLLNGQPVDKAGLTPLIGFILKTNELFQETGQTKKGSLLELAKPKGRLPVDPLMQLRPGLWERTRELVFLKGYAPNEETAGLVRVYAQAAGEVRGLRAFVVGMEPATANGQTGDGMGGQGHALASR